MTRPFPVPLLLSLCLVAVPLLLCGLAPAARAAAAPSPAQADTLVTLPQADNFAARKAAFKSRNSPAHLSSLGRDFLSRTYVGSWDLQEFNKPGGWETLKEVRAHLDRKEFAPALELFKTHTMEKFRSIESSGLPRGRFDPFSTGELHSGKYWPDASSPTVYQQDRTRFRAGISCYGRETRTHALRLAASWRVANSNGLVP